jgi:hypothetical protein
MFDQMVEDGHGKIITLDKIKGYDEDIRVWCDSKIELTDKKTLSHPVMREKVSEEGKSAA